MGLFYDKVMRMREKGRTFTTSKPVTVTVNKTTTKKVKKVVEKPTEVIKNDTGTGDKS